MPELPDVEGFRRVLAKRAGRRIREVVVRDAGVLRQTSSRRLQRALCGRRFLEPARHGKWLIAPTDARATLLIHFGMTGSLTWHGPGEPRHRHDRVILAFAEGELRYRDLRKLQGLRLAMEPRDIEEVLGNLGPDALALSRRDFDRRIRGRRQLKAAFLDQSVIAGLGNLLADEILWRSRIHPARKADRLTEAQRQAIFREMRRVLRASVRAGCVPGRKGWLTGVRDEKGAVCPRCRTRLRRATVAGRTTVWCPRCQRGERAR